MNIKITLAVVGTIVAGIACFIFLNKDDYLPNSNNEVAVVSEITPTNPEVELVEVEPEIVEEIEEIEPEIIEEIEEIEEEIVEPEIVEPEPEPEISVEASTISIEEPTPVVVETPVVETPVVETPVASTDTTNNSTSSSDSSNAYGGYNLSGMQWTSTQNELEVTAEDIASLWDDYTNPDAPTSGYVFGSR